MIEVKKGDKVLFEVRAHPLDVRVGVVKFRPQNGFVDLLCEGEHADYRAAVDTIKKKYGNVFK